MDSFYSFFQKYCQTRGFTAEETDPQVLKNFEEWDQLSYKGIYLYGPVGRGKSTIMRAFYEFHPTAHKKWFHFTDWVMHVQRQFALQSSQKTSSSFFSALSSPLEKIAKEIRKDTHFLFLDEFSINHIADAVLIHQLFPLLLKKGVKIFITSNTPPELIYKNGLNRDRIEALFTLLNSQLMVVNLVGPEDFRQRKLTKNFHYFVDKEKFTAFLSTLAPLSLFSPLSLFHDQRQFNLITTYGPLAFCSFDELCTKNRSLQDYQLFFPPIKNLLMYDLPPLSQENINSVKRFITLIDFLYDNKVDFSLHGLTPFDKINEITENIPSFARTFSRLTEMLSKK